MYTEEDLVNYVLRARMENTDEVTFVDDEGSRVKLKIETINPQGICSPYD